MRYRARFIRSSQFKDWHDLEKSLGKFSEKYMEITMKVLDKIANEFIEIVKHDFGARGDVFSTLNEEERKKFEGITNELIMSSIKVDKDNYGYVVAGIPDDFFIRGQSIIQFLLSKEYGLLGDSHIGVWRSAYSKIEKRLEYILREEFSKVKLLDAGLGE
jgi:hypothetical protein